MRLQEALDRIAELEDEKLALNQRIDHLLLRVDVLSTLLVDHELRLLHQWPREDK